MRPARLCVPCCAANDCVLNNDVAMPQAMIEDTSVYQAGDTTSDMPFSADLSSYHPNPALMTGTELPILPYMFSVKATSADIKAAAECFSPVCVM